MVDHEAAETDQAVPTGTTESENAATLPAVHWTQEAEVDYTKSILLICGRVHADSLLRTLHP